MCSPSLLRRSRELDATACPASEPIDTASSSSGSRRRFVEEVRKRHVLVYGWGPLVVCVARPEFCCRIRLGCRKPCLPYMQPRLVLRRSCRRRTVGAFLVFARYGCVDWLRAAPVQLLLWRESRERRVPGRVVDIANQIREGQSRGRSRRWGKHLLGGSRGVSKALSMSFTTLDVLGVCFVEGLSSAVGQFSFSASRSLADSSGSVSSSWKALSLVRVWVEGMIGGPVTTCRARGAPSLCWRG